MTDEHLDDLIAQMRPGSRMTDDDVLCRECGVPLYMGHDPECSGVDVDVLVLACGSRDWPAADVIDQAIATLPGRFPGRVVTVMHGGARGADVIAGRAAAEAGLPVQVHRANWALGKRAGIVRNLAMLDRQPDLVLAFWHHRSRGTAHVVHEARARGIQVDVWDGREHA